jgi:hypothetical protein
VETTGSELLITQVATTRSDLFIVEAVTTGPELLITVNSPDLVVITAVIKRSGPVVTT